jgi:hypothetical protein
MFTWIWVRCTSLKKFRPHKNWPAKGGRVGNASLKNVPQTLVGPSDELSGCRAAIDHSVTRSSSFNSICRDNPSESRSSGFVSRRLGSPSVSRVNDFAGLGQAGHQSGWSPISPVAHQVREGKLVVSPVAELVLTDLLACDRPILRITAGLRVIGAQETHIPSRN